MSSLYPEIEPFYSGELNVGEGHTVFWECCGNPEGKPAVVLHGGPGSGCHAGFRRFFNPEAYRIVLFDQRGCGRSSPLAGDPAVALDTNTTDFLVRDVETLRQHLDIEKWLLFGGSWGSTLGLAYATRFPDRVTEMVLFAVVTTSRREVRWVTRDIGRLFPPEWSRFRDGVPADQRDGDLVEAYWRLLNDPDPDVRHKAAGDWCDWETAHVSLRPSTRNARWDDPEFQYRFARLVTHYWRHAAWLEDGALLRDADKLANIPGVLIHGRLDVSSPIDIPWEISKAWPGSRLVIVDDAGHSAGLGDNMVAETDEFAKV